MLIVIAVGLVILGGALNGTFSIPGRYIKTMSNNKVWIYLSCWSYLIIPVATLWLINRECLWGLLEVPISAIIVALIGGFIWGLGMVFCILGFRTIGLSVTYAINIGLGTAGGALLPLLLFHRDKVVTLFGALVALAVFVFLIGVILATRAAKERDHVEKETVSTHTAKGVMYAILAGLGSSAQGVAFSYATAFFVSSPTLQPFSLLVRSNLPWIWIFLGAFFPNIIFFLYSYKKEEEFKGSNLLKDKIGDHLKIVTMGILFFECLILYGLSAGLLGSLGTVIAYPMFMVMIVLTSNFWGFFFHEWRDASKQAKGHIQWAIVILLVAVIIQTVASLCS